MFARGAEVERDFSFGVVRQLFEPVLASARSAGRGGSCGTRGTRARTLRELTFQLASFTRSERKQVVQGEREAAEGAVMSGVAAAKLESDVKGGGGLRAAEDEDLLHEPLCRDSLCRRFHGHTED